MVQQHATLSSSTAQQDPADRLLTEACTTSVPANPVLALVANARRATGPTARPQPRSQSLQQQLHLGDDCCGGGCAKGTGAKPATSMPPCCCSCASCALAMAAASDRCTKGPEAGPLPASPLAAAQRLHVDDGCCKELGSCESSQTRLAPSRPQLPRDASARRCWAGLQNNCPAQAYRDLPPAQRELRAAGNGKNPCCNTPAQTVHYNLKRGLLFESESNCPLC